MITTVLLRDRVQQKRMPSDVPLFDISPLPDGRLLCSTPAGELGMHDANTGKAAKLIETDTRNLHSVRWAPVIPVGLVGA